MSNQSAEYGSYNKHHNEHYPTKSYDDCQSSISPWGAYIIWFIILIVLIWILRAFGIKWFSAVVFSLVVAAIVLTCIYPFQFRKGKYEYCSSDALYCLIMLFTIILLIIWFIWKVFTDRDYHDNKNRMMKQSHMKSDSDVDWRWDATSSGPTGQTVASGHGSIHKSPSISSVAPSGYSSKSVPLPQMKSSGPF